jgi:hypothetical protein
MGAFAKSVTMHLIEGSNQMVYLLDLLDFMLEFQVKLSEHIIENR